MAASDHLSPVQFSWKSTDEEHNIKARMGNKYVGWLDLDRGTGVVNNVYVKEEHQGKGIATRMWKLAQKAGMNPAHSDTRSEAGDAWAHSLHKKGLAPEPHPTDVENW